MRLCLRLLYQWFMVVPYDGKTCGELDEGQYQG